MTRRRKKLRRRVPGHLHLSETIAAENKLFGAMLSAPEAKEAFTAFFQKRKPDFSQFA